MESVEKNVTWITEDDNGKYTVTKSKNTDETTKHRANYEVTVTETKEVLAVLTGLDDAQRYIQKLRAAWPLPRSLPD